MAHQRVTSPPFQTRQAPGQRWPPKPSMSLRLRTVLSFLALFHIASSITYRLNLAVNLTKAKDSRNMSSSNPSNSPSCLGQPSSQFQSQFFPCPTPQQSVFHLHGQPFLKIGPCSSLSASPHPRSPPLGCRGRCSFPTTSSGLV